MMTSAHSDELPHSRSLPLLLILFVGSGCAALIYEIVWFQLLQLVIGSSAVSLGVLLGTFMGGMCLGSILLPRLVSPRRHPLRVYAMLELGIGAIGLALLFGMPLIDQLYAASGAHGFTGLLLRAAISAICLLPPTLLMGATLPAIARWIQTTREGVSWLGFFYGGNIAGAVFGCLLAGFYLLRVYDMALATYIAVALNTAVALLGLSLSAIAPHRTPSEPTARSSILERAPHAWTVYLTIAFSGLTALGAEVVWTRLLSLMFGGSVYTFSIILAVFLAGLGIGSAAGSFISRTSPDPRRALGWCQMLLTASIAWTALTIAKSLAYLPINPALSTSPWFTFQLDLMRCMWSILPATLLWGASFPLALAGVAARGQDPGKMVGGVYAANTIGAIVGALGFSMIFIPQFGTQQSQRILIAVAFVAALLVLAPLARRAGGAMGLVICAVVAVVLIGTVGPPPPELVAYGRYAATRIGESDMLYLGEGMNSTIAVTKLRASDVRNFHVSGKIEASTEPQDMRLQRMLGVIPSLLHPKPESVLVVGCGAGVTAGSFVPHPDVKRIVLCEIEPLIPEVVAKYFSEQNYDVVTDPRVQIVNDDARHFVLTTPEKFDIITSDPIHPWVKGSATLYTKEYFEMCKQHLNPGGIVTQWVPLYESNLEAVKSEIATFLEVFPEGTVWSNDVGGEGYDLVLLGCAGEKPMQIDVDQLQQKLTEPRFAEMAEALREVGFMSGIDVLATFAAQGSDLRGWLADAQINRDRNLRLQYLAGMGLNASHSGELIYDQLIRKRKFPDQLFVASDRRLQTLRFALEGPPTTQTTKQ